MAESGSDRRPVWATTGAARAVISIVALVALVAWASKVVNLTILGYGGVPRLPGEWRPLVSMWQIAVGPGNALYQLGGNVLLFLPLGLLLPLVWERMFRRLVPTLAVGVALSAGIELAQLSLVDGRVAATDDVILNVSGVLVGWLLWRALVKLLGGTNPAAAGSRRGSQS
jgi:glycopeptide antibiotics resistance protein